ncbi:MAG: hypothetical protein Q4F49_07835 [Pseudoxanthomonas suwonensis]|nr:hypothetical protein [Pseudoxanthomonas suwonensis]
MNRRRRLLALLLLPLLAACASGGSRQMDALQSAQYDWSAAIRWGDFEGALALVDPQVRRDHPVSDVELGRFQQIQISGYTELGSRLDGEGHAARREIRIGVINRHTMAERNVRHTETWRYDAEAKRWWNTSGLPDLWAGE